jgi:hydroxymethylglutaryl-CoA lyase
MRSPNKNRIFIQEVSARDGFQMERQFVPTTQKIEYIDRMSRTGVAKIEVTSFTAPSVIPALADAEAVLGGITRIAGVEYTALVPNLRGCERALASGVDEINLVMSASESHNRANLRMGCEQSLVQFENITKRAKGAVQFSASLSTAFGCPFEGEITTDRVLDLVRRIVQMGIARVSLCDTTGVANPAQVERLFGEACNRWADVQFTAHFHNTRGMGLANVLAALEVGVERFDASLGGLGGCPFAPGATGNICTVDLVHMLQAMGYDTGVDLCGLLEIALGLVKIVGHELSGQVVKAGPYQRRYPMPDAVRDEPSKNPPSAAAPIVAP